FQNHGEDAKASEVLLTKLDSLKKEEALIRFNVKLNEWYTKITH
ncbi:class I SAM-dependent methyltransferase, partial [Lactobacillus helveticus]|nr:class I SAM-dependent methyltransferase [Lactobacillus helveticus]